MSGSSPALPSEGDPLYHDGVSYYTTRNFVFVEGFDAVFVEGFGGSFCGGIWCRGKTFHFCGLDG